MCDAPPASPPCPLPPRIPCAEASQTPPRTKPLMRGLHWAQTKNNIAVGLGLSCLAGACVYFFVGRRRKQAYKDYFATAEFESWADEMARKGLFQSVPREVLEEYNKK